MNNPGGQAQLWCKANLNYPPSPALSLESVAEMLMKATQISASVSFQWSYIDRPSDGSVFLVFLQPNTLSPPDGFMYMDQEQVYQVNVAGKTIEMCEHKFGFVPNVEPMTSRIRRRFRLLRGGNDQLWILHFSRSDEATRMQASIVNARPQPVRQYPLPTVTTKAFLLFAPQMPIHQQQQQQTLSSANIPPPQVRQGVPSSSQLPPRPMPYHNPQQIPISQQTPLVKRPRTDNNVTVPVASQAAVAEELEEPVGDEFDSLTPRDVSLARYQLHHEWMEEILSQYSTKHIKAPSLFLTTPDADVLEAQIQDTQADITQLRERHKMQIGNIQAQRVKQVLTESTERIRNAKTPAEVESIERLVEEGLGLKGVRKILVREIPLASQ